MSSSAQTPVGLWCKKKKRTKNAVNAKMARHFALHWTRYINSRPCVCAASEHVRSYSLHICSNQDSIKPTLLDEFLKQLQAEMYLLRARRQLHLLTPRFEIARRQETPPTYSGRSFCKGHFSGVATGGCPPTLRFGIAGCPPGLNRFQVCPGQLQKF